MSVTPLTPIFFGRDSIYEAADLVWWIPRVGSAPEGWFDLGGHACSGFGLDYMEGWVTPLEPSAAGWKVLENIAAEEFAKSCTPSDLDYGVTDQHRIAYVAYLAERGLEAGDLTRLVQAVYPLAASHQNLLALGVEEAAIPPDACLLILGSNCD